MKSLLRLSVMLAAASMPLTALAADSTFAEKPFTDVAKNSPYYQAIEYLRTNNVLKGYEDGTFKPNSRINRAEFVKLITNPFIMNTDRMNVCMQKYDGRTEGKIFFKDVPTTAWYAPEVCHSKDRNIISGYLDGTFRPTNNTNLAEAAKILAGVFSFQVREEGTPWYKPYVDRLSEVNALPTTLTTLNAPITRGQMAEILYRLKTNDTSKASKSASQLY